MSFLLFVSLMFAARAVLAQEPDTIQQLEQEARSANDSVRAQALRKLNEHYAAIVTAFFREGQFDSALVYCEKAEAIFKSHNSVENLATIYSRMGTVYSEIDLAKSIEYKYKALELSEKIGDLNTQGVLHINIGNTLFKLGRIDEARKEVTRGIDIFKELDDLNWLSNGYKILSNLYDEDERLAYTRLSLEYAEKNGDLHRIFSCRDKLINTCQVYDRWAESLTLLDKHMLSLARMQFPEHLLTFHKVNIYLELALGHYKQDHGVYKLYLDSAEQLTVPVDKLGTTHYRNLLSLYKDVYKNLGMYQKAFDYLNSRDSLEKAILTERSDLALSKLKTQYETEKKEQEIASLRQAAEIQSLRLNGYLIGGASLLLLIGGGGFFSYRQYKTRRDKAALELEQRFLRSQLNPHFIFNSMGAIQQYLLTESPAKASDYMSLFSRLMRQILENSREEFITIEEEISMLTNYLELQKLRFQNSFSYTIELDDALDPEYDGIPPMFAQPFIENALEHGLFKKDQNEIRIKFSKTSENLIRLEIVDSGTGMMEKLSKTSDHQSLATKITNERLGKMRVTYKTDLSLTAENITDEAGEVKGYRVSLSLPTRLVAA